MTQAQVVKVFTPVKRVPTVIGKAQNGQKLPFGPYTLPQVAGVAGGLLLTATCALTLPINPAVTFLIGVVLTVVITFLLGLIPYTGIRLTSRVWWLARLIFDPRPVSASGMPVTPESGRLTSFIEETVVLILPDRDPATRSEPEKPEQSRGMFQDIFARGRAEPATDGPALKAIASSGWRAITNGNGMRPTTGEGR
ncbi:hypothetical protein [Nocardia paucivorans]|uniref:hypothetical protein n=1 Tax=Nocardia paucivorans TaxID=114259 RepID=UPI0002D5CC0D|nr:hypothetical protein [Nocardia paucivorans]